MEGARLGSRSVPFIQRFTFPKLPSAFALFESPPTPGPNSRGGRVKPNLSLIPVQKDRGRRTMKAYDKPSASQLTPPHRRAAAHLNMVFTQGPLSLGESSGRERCLLR